MKRERPWDVDWLHERRVQAYARIMLVTFVVLWSVYALGGSGLSARGGEIIGADFQVFYAASALASEGRAADAYDQAKLMAAERERTGSTDRHIWGYPPDLFIVVAPLAHLPYLLAFGTWALLGTGLYLATLRAIAPVRGLMVVSLSFGGWLLSVTQGQNGCISAAILGAGLVFLDTRPRLSGATLGLLTYKPQLALLVPLLLLSTRRWPHVVSFVASAACVAVLSAMIFGLDAWVAFVRHSSDALQVLEAGGFKLEKMPTVTAALLLLNVPGSFALAVQAVVAAAAVTTALFIWRKEPSSRMAAVVVPPAILLCTPYAYDYDLAVLAVSGAFLFAEARERGWLGGEKAAMAAVWAAAPALPLIAIGTHVQVGPLVVALPLLLALRRTLANRSAVQVASEAGGEVERQSGAVAG